MNKISKVILALIALFALITSWTMENGLLFEYNCPDDRYTLRIDDYEGAAFAYLIKYDEICADVWLYNSSGTPEKTDWFRSPDIYPGSNPCEFVNEDSYQILPVSEDDFDVHFEFDENHNLVRAYIYIKGKLIASIADGDRPGYSNLVSKTGPLAKKMSDGIQPNQRPRFQRRDTY